MCVGAHRRAARARWAARTHACPPKPADSSALRLRRRAVVAWENAAGLPARALLVKKVGVPEASRRLAEIAGWLAERGVQARAGLAAGSWARGGSARAPMARCQERAAPTRTHHAAPLDSTSTRKRHTCTRLRTPTLPRPPRRTSSAPFTRASSPTSRPTSAA